MEFETFAGRALLGIGVGLVRNLWGFLQKWSAGGVKLSDYDVHQLGETSLRVGALDTFGGSVLSTILGVPIEATAGVGFAADLLLPKKESSSPSNAPAAPEFIVIPSQRESGTSPTSVQHAYRLLDGSTAKGRVGSALKTKEGTYVTLDEEVRLYAPGNEQEAEKVRKAAQEEVEAAWRAANREVPVA